MAPYNMPNAVLEMIGKPRIRFLAETKFPADAETVPARLNIKPQNE